MLGAAVVFVAASGAKAQAVPDAPRTNGLQIPRYASLKADRVSLRQGPGAEHPTAWVFKRTGLPVEIIEEIEVWRKVRDCGRH